MTNALRDMPILFITVVEIGRTSIDRMVRVVCVTRVSSGRLSSV